MSEENKQRLKNIKGNYRKAIKINITNFYIFFTWHKNGTKSLNFQ